MLRQQRAVRPYGYGLTLQGGLRRKMQAASPILIDVRMGGRLVTIPGSRDEMCSTILDKLDLDIDQFYLMLNGKLLQWGRVPGDYDVSERFTIQVLPILRGGGTFFSFLVHFFFRSKITAASIHAPHP